MGGNQNRAPRAWFVLVAGWPASGKSTLATGLAAELGLPLLAKDEIKEALMDGLGRPGTSTPPARSTSRRSPPRWPGCARPIKSPEYDKSP